MILESILLAVVMALGAAAGMAEAGQQKARRVPWLTLSIALLTLIGFTLQLALPGTLEALQRSGTAAAGGQWWRLLTALLVQDGGWAGFIFNLVGLVLVGAWAEQLISRKAWVALYLMPALLVELIALSWQPIGAGNSIAWMALAGAVWVVALRRRGSGLRLSVLGATGLALGILLSAMRNIHGPAILLGAALELGFVGSFLAISVQRERSENDRQ